MANPSIKLGGGKWAIKGGKLLGYALNLSKYIPIEFDFSRSSGKTRINPNILVEDLPYNRFNYSEDLSNGFWSKRAVTASVNQLITSNDALNTDRSITVTQNFISGTKYYFQCRFKYINVTYGYIRIIAGAFTDSIAYFNIQNGTLGTCTAGASSSIEADGNGYYICKIEITATSTASSFLRIGMSEDGINQALTGDGVKGIYLSKLQYADSNKPYLPTTDRLNLASIDYGTGESALLVEPQATNLLTYSNDFSNASWVKPSLTLTQNVVSPDGGLNAWSLVPFIGNGLQIYKSATTSLGFLTGSIFVKSLGYNYFKMYTKAVNGGAYITINVNLINGTVSGASGAITGKIKPLLNGWYRFEYTVNVTTTSSTIAMYIIGTDDTFNTLSGDGIIGLGIYEAQLETGSVATSTIPTTSATITRVADAVSKTGISSLIGQTEGVLFVEMAALVDNNTDRDITLSDGTLNNVIRIRLSRFTGNLGFYVVSSGVESFGVLKPSITQTSYNKIALKYQQNSFSVWLNGVNIFTDNTGNVPETNILKFSDAITANPFYGKLKQLQVFKTALTDEELITLTTL